ncbi:unnamed protein product [Caenorhabditis nigoni]
MICSLKLHPTAREAVNLSDDIRNLPPEKADVFLMNFSDEQKPRRDNRSAAKVGESLEQTLFCKTPNVIVKGFQIQRVSPYPKNSQNVKQCPDELDEFAAELVAYMKSLEDAKSLAVISPDGNTI